MLLDGLYDGVPRSEEGLAPACPIAFPSLSDLLANAERRGVSRAALGAAVQLSRRPEGLAAALMEKDLLPARPFPEAQSLHGFVRWLWFWVARAAPLPFRIDSSWAIPSLVIERGGTEFHLHGINHGFLMPEGWGVIRSLVSELRGAGAALYSEENLPMIYFYRYGSEFSDHRVIFGGKTGLHPISPLSLGLRLVSRLVVRALAAAGLAVTAYLLFDGPDPYLWALFLFWTALNAVLWVGAPLWRLLEPLYLAMAYPNPSHRRQAAWASGTLDHNPIDILRARRLLEPQPLGAELDRREARGLLASWTMCRERSEEMARAALKDALKRGLASAHLLVGFGHVFEIAEALRSLEVAMTAAKPKGPGLGRP